MGIEVTMTSSTKLLTVITGTRGRWTTITTPEDTQLILAAATTNYSNAASFSVRLDARIGIMKFDLTSIPATKKIVSADLYLYSSTAPTSNATLTAYSILAANSDMVFAEMTWNIRKTGTAWAGDTGGDGGADAGCTVSGTDHNATVLGSVVFVGGSANGTEMVMSLNTAMVEAWLTNNYGLVMKSDLAESPTIHSQQSATEAYRPKLKIKYTP